MLGPLLHCIGKFIKINGLFDTLIETGTFGVKTAEEVVGGTHYVRSFRGMLILLEALLKRKWEKTDANIFKNLDTNFKPYQRNLKNR